MTEAVLAMVLVALSHALQVRVNWNMADEGFLWNGTLRIGQGKIPVRDYKSYDPGRFYWSWAWMRLFGTGLLGLRHAAAVFQALGLWAGLAVLGTLTDNLLALVLAGIVLVLWMQPRHKLFEHAMAMIAVFALTLLFQAPSAGTAFFAGLVTGIAGVMGRNHVVYTFAASVLALILLAVKAGTGGLAGPWALGAGVGYTPMLAMFVFVPGMLRSYVHDKVLVFFRRGKIANRRPPPWPWAIDYTGLGRVDRVSRFLAGLHFVAVPVFYAGALAWIAFSPTLPESACLTAACVVGMFYLHHAVSRSDLSHLCQAIHPFLIALLALAFSAANPLVFWLGPAALIAVAALVIRQIDPRLLWLRARDRYAEIEVRGERLVVPRGHAGLVTRLRVLVETHLGPDETLFIAPTSALLYPVLEKETPVRSDFMLFPETEAAQDAMIADLQRNHVDWALIQDIALDGRDELRFRNTHAKVWAYLETHFERLQTDGLGARWGFWRRKIRSNAA